MKAKASSTTPLDWPVPNNNSDQAKDPVGIDGTVLTLKCGASSCRFCVKCYRCYVDPDAEVEEEEEEEESESESESEDEEEEEEEEEESGKVSDKDASGSVKSAESSSKSMDKPGASSSPSPTSQAGLLPKKMNVLVEMEEGRLEGSSAGEVPSTNIRMATTAFFHEQAEEEGRGEEEEEEEGEGEGKEEEEKKRLVTS